MRVFIFFLIYYLYHLYLSHKLEKTGDAYYNNRIINNKTTPKIYDIAHKYLPNFYKYDNIHHVLTILFTIPIFFNFNMLQEYLGFWIVIFIIRSITMTVTILPKYKECTYDGVRPFVGGCYDKIFSGHFVSVFLATLLYLKYGWIKMPLLVIINIINTLSILLSRGHYTVDVIVAFFVTMFVYQNNISLNY